MKFGIHSFPTQTSFQPADLARAVEERGLESLWFSEHTHIPVRFLKDPGRATSLPEYYWQTYDIFIALTLAAASTHTLKLGTGIALIVEHDPILLAKEAATLDLISQGRFLFGIGAGWIEPEMADHGVVYRTRFQLLKEQVRAMQAIWTMTESEFHGRFVNFDKMKAFPKPHQQPHPPIIMGGEGDKAIECAAEIGNGWAPWMMDWEKARDGIKKLKEQAAALGRDAEALEISLFERDIPSRQRIAEMEQAGVSRVIITLLGQSRAEALPTLDALAQLNS